ncbi:hypothetical protein CDEF62S_02079 [Castellaniella defragrans]
MNDLSAPFMTQLRAEHDIKRVLQQYCRGVDRRDFKLVRSVYHADAEDHHGPYNGNVDGLIHWMTRRHEGVAQSMHMLGNCLIDWRTDSVALVETYCVTYQRLKENGASSTSDVGLTVGGSGQQHKYAAAIWTASRSATGNGRSPTVSLPMNRCCSKTRLPDHPLQAACN